MTEHEIPLDKLSQIAHDICRVKHPVVRAWTYTDEDSGHTFWTILCGSNSTFGLTFTDKPDVLIANIWSVPALKREMSWDEAAEVILAARLGDA